jgi:hypothetical protein
MPKFYVLPTCEKEFYFCLKQDPLLSQKGKDDAKQIHGFYDLVLLSPLRRAIQTLEESNITYKEALIAEECRNPKQFIHDFKIDEELFTKNNSLEQEKINNVLRRVKEFKQMLLDIELNKKYQKVLIITDTHIFRYMNTGCSYGKIIEIPLTQLVEHSF